MEQQKIEATDRLLKALPYLRFAVEEAKLEGAAKIGILSTLPSGAGRIVASFEVAGFFDDLATILGAPAQTEEDTANAQAVKFLDKNGLRQK